MIKALENPNYKKIWEYVNWQVRHPEAKSLEEALEIESKNRLCFVTSPQWGYFKDSQGKSYRKYFDGELFTVGEYEIYSDRNVCGGFATILGRAITLADIMMILPKTFAYWNAYNSIVDIQFSNGYDVIGFNLQWLPSKLLHEQSEDTWFMLSKFIKTREHVLTVDELPS